ncbi:hypothetical cyanophage protein [Synechococcus phage S-CRM01]|uniref:hypothetical cyanophage protein n=1 Tax=Synechococcus phage S-CRM01 TaxID=1026955 RepID=UPI000209E3B2|nr:hypothetical cyanophage protein [Synechococcus phage S-CRM01]AEC53064.1 hypothetical cyanophage protein [Synechococcus phage S-CRM01]
MGLFDTVYCHYKPLGEDFIGVALQTKSLECGLSSFWISPAGELFKFDWANSMKMVDKPRIVMRNGTKPTYRGLPFEWVPTGKNKKLTPVYHTGFVILYPEKSLELDLWPEASALFKHGKIIYYETRTIEVR